MHLAFIYSAHLWTPNVCDNNIPYTWNFSRYVYFTVEHEIRIFAVEISRMKVIQKFSRFSCLQLQGYV